LYPNEPGRLEKTSTMTAMAGSSGQHRLQRGEDEIRRAWYG
jgi:hypothetical protein